MKHIFCAILVLAFVYAAHAGLIETPVDQAIPDGDLSGLASTIHLSGMPDMIGTVQIELNISGSYNGDLYAYLTHGTGFAVLLNRVGRSATDDLGYNDGGLAVTFTDGASDVHNYRRSLFGNSSTALGGPLTGTWAPDGRAISPEMVTDADARSALLTSFQGLDANGDWTLFVADINGGDGHQLNSWSLLLDASVPEAPVPESGQTGLLLLAGLTGLILIRWPSKRRNATMPTKRTPFLRWRCRWGLVLACLLAGSGEVWAITGGTLTGWGQTIVYPLFPPGTKFTKIASSSGSYALALTQNGTVVAWGYNAGGQCEVPDGLSGVTAILAADFPLALKEDGTVVGWGRDPGLLRVPSGLTDVTTLSSSGMHVLALKRDGTVVAWGYNYWGQCDVPVGLRGVVSVSAGYGHSVALKADGTVVAWGDNFDGQVNVPSGLSDVVAISAGDHHTIALKRDDTLVVWGGIAAEGTPYWPPPVLPGGLHGVIRILAGRDDSGMALQADGTVAAWGYPNLGMGIPSDLHDVIEIDGSPYFGLALREDGTVVEWSGIGELTPPSGVSGVVAIASGLPNVALKSDGTVITWDRDSVDGPNQPLSGVVAVAYNLVLQDNGTVTTWPSGSTGSFSDVPSNLGDVVAMAPPIVLRSDGTVTGWGSFWQGGVFERKPGIRIPEAMGGVTAITAGSSFLALKSDGTLANWGYGYGVVSDYPVLTALKEIVAMAEGLGYLFLKADGTVLAWGDNGFGQSSVPVGLSGVVAIAAGSGFWSEPSGLSHYGAHRLALKDDGTVVAWGDNSFGQCNVPSDLKEVIAIAAGSFHSLALRADRTVVAWGDNRMGQCHVPSRLRNVVSISAEGAESYAIYGGVNQPPQTAGYQLSTPRDTAKSIPAFKLHRACSDPDWDTFILNEVSRTSTAGGSVQFNGSTILYTPPLDFVGSDAFTYTVRDSRGASSQGSVQVTVTAPTGSGPNILNVTVAPGGAATVRCAGVPGASYVLEASSDLVQWIEVGTSTAPPNGLLEFVDTQAPNYATRYYRTRDGVPAL